MHFEKNPISFQKTSKFKEFPPRPLEILRIGHQSLLKWGKDLKTTALPDNDWINQNFGIRSKTFRPVLTSECEFTIHTIITNQSNNNTAQQWPALSIILMWRDYLREHKSTRWMVGLERNSKLETTCSLANKTPISHSDLWLLLLPLGYQTCLQRPNITLSQSWRYQFTRWKSCCLCRGNYYNVKVQVVMVNRP